ncbi:MAG: acetylglutamate kinase [Chloroflexi bacterium]|nr:acetylglutamate kinase [Chloroflexota bacterium]
MNAAVTDGPIVIKIGGSTLGEHDTSLADCVELHRAGHQVVIVHGGGAAVSDWQKRLGAEAAWVDGLRATTPESLEVVVAVLTGLINKELARQLQQLGAPAVGVSGVDGGTLCSPISTRIGLVGETPRCNPGTLRKLLAAGLLPILAPVGLADDLSIMLNINADTAAGAVAAALGASMLIYLTDVLQVRDGDGAGIDCLDAERQERLTREGVIAGGMLPKLRSGRAAVEAGCRVRIVDGTQSHVVRQVVDGEAIGTAVV